MIGDDSTFSQFSTVSLSAKLSYTFRVFRELCYTTLEVMNGFESTKIHTISQRHLTS